MRALTFLCALVLIQSCGIFPSDSDQRPSYAPYPTNLTEQLRARADACQASESDLLPQSVKAITLDQTERLIAIYQSIYLDPDMPAHMQAESLYQIGLIHMNEYNARQNDKAAKQIFHRLKKEFPNSALCQRADHHLAVIENRKQP